MRSSALVLTLLVVGSARMALAQPEAKEKLPSLLTAQPIKPAQADDALRKLLIARYNAALAELQGRFKQRFRDINATMGPIFPLTKRLGDAGMELNAKAADQVALREQLLELLTFFDKQAEGMWTGGQATPADREQARYYRLDAEIQLLRAQRKAKAAQP